MNILIYLIKTVLVSGLLLAYYWLFLRNRFFHGFNRYYLLSIPVLGFLLPALHLSLPSFWNHAASGSPILLLGVGQGSVEEAVTIYANQQSGKGFSLEFIMVILSLLITAFLFIRFYKSIRFLYQLRKEKPFLILPEATVYFVSEKGTPFSFFKSIFWGKELVLESEAGEQILQHEIYHVKNNHSLDILSLEILTIAMWFNPFLYLIRQELKAIHEYAADAWVAAKTDTYAYASLLLLNVSGSALPITHPFFKNQIKRRITMMTKSKKQKAGLLGRFFILPVIAILIGLFSFKMHNVIHFSSAKPIRVVIDAGHGGNFIGTQFNGVLEKNINLTIAKKIKSLASQYNVEVIMSRETDITPGSNELQESLKYIADLPKNNNADLFVSIHTNATGNEQEGKLQSSKSGFEIYIPRNSSEVYEGSLKFGSAMAEVIKSDYSIEHELKQTPGDGGNIYILKNATVPALLIECGYMDNPADLKYLQDDRNLEKIARDILEGIRKYSMETTRYAPPIVISTDSIPSDTTSMESIKKMDQIKIASINVDRNSRLITITTKDGKKLYAVITDEMIHSWDSARIVRDNASDLVNADQAVFTKPRIVRDNASDLVNPDQAVFTKVEVEAEYPGGQHAWYEYLSKNLKYPEAAIKKEIQGQVMMEFIVNKNGEVSNIRVVSGPEELKGSSVDVIKGSGKWIPAKQNGQVVESYKWQPINYKLERQN
jgi:TonB family protein